MKFTKYLERLFGEMLITSFLYSNREGVYTD